MVSLSLVFNVLSAAQSSHVQREGGGGGEEGESVASHWILTSCKPHSHPRGLVSWRFESSQPERVISGLKTNLGLSPSYS